MARASGILSAMDHFDLGFHAISWWAFQPRSAKTKAAFIMSELVSTTIGASTLPTDDMDGKTVAMNKGSRTTTTRTRRTSSRRSRTRS